MRRALALIALLLAATPAGAMLLLPREIVLSPQWTITVNARVGNTSLQYKTTAWVYAPGPAYTAKLFAVGPYYNGSEPGTASGFDQVIANEPAGAAFNGGYWDNDPFVPAGLLLVNGKVYHQFDFAKRQGVFGESAVVCIDSDGRLKALHTADFVAPTAHIVSTCRSALQAGPFVVDGGRSGIRNPRGQAVRTILGFDPQGSPVLVVFQQPVDLLSAAAFLLARKGAAQSVQITNGRTASGLTSSAGLGLVTAINLNGAAGVACYFRKVRVAGYPSLALPSAFTLAGR